MKKFRLFNLLLLSISLIGIGLVSSNSAFKNSESIVMISADNEMSYDEFITEYTHIRTTQQETGRPSAGHRPGRYAAADDSPGAGLRQRSCRKL